MDWTTPVSGRKLTSEPPIPEQFLDMAGVGVLVAEPETGRIRFINKRGRALLGYSQTEIVTGHYTVVSLTHPDDCEVSAAAFARLLSGEVNQYSLEKRYLHKDGTAVWVHITVALFRDEAGHPQWCGVAVGEMSERRILELQLDAARRLAGMTTWYWEVKSDRAMTSAGWMVSDNRFPVTSFRKTLSGIHPDDRRAVQATIERAVTTGAGYSHEYRVIRTNGEIRHMRGTATCLFDQSGKVTHLVGASIDITEIKERQSADQAPKTIRAILDHIETNWNKPIYIEQLARQHGISARAIQRYFATRRMTPLTKHIKQVRLRHAHQALSNPKRGTSVTGVALHCGFQNPGHFSRDYREEFGELPSETLRNALQLKDVAP